MRATFCRETWSSAEAENAAQGARKPDNEAPKGLDGLKKSWAPTSVRDGKAFLRKIRRARAPDLGEENPISGYRTSSSSGVVWLCVASGRLDYSSSPKNR